MAENTASAETAALESAGGILALVASGIARTRPALLKASGLSRATVSQRLNALLAHGLVRETSVLLPSGGRPTRQFAVDPACGHVLVANIGETHLHLAAVDLAAAVICQTTAPFRRAAAPGKTLDRIAAAFHDLSRQAAVAHPITMGIGLSLPTPVDFARGRVVGPSVLTGWDDFDITGWLADRFEVPVYVENDVNLMSLFEHRTHHRDIDEMMFIKAGTGIGSGLISSGRIFRGAHGAAGDIGHLQVLTEDAPLCRCGKFGCIEARAAGWAIARDLTARGLSAETARDVVTLAKAQSPEALTLVRQAGRVLGEAVAAAISIVNPRRIVIGGTLAATGEPLLSGIRELVYQRCLPLATRDLTIVASRHTGDMALFGAAHLVIEDLFSPQKVDALIARLPR